MSYLVASSWCSFTTKTRLSHHFDPTTGSTHSHGNPTRHTATLLLEGNLLPWRWSPRQRVSSHWGGVSGAVAFLWEYIYDRLSALSQGGLVYRQATAIQYLIGIMNDVWKRVRRDKKLISELTTAIMTNVWGRILRMEELSPGMYPLPQHRSCDHDVWSQQQWAWHAHGFQAHMLQWREFPGKVWSVTVPLVMYC